MTEAPALTLVSAVVLLALASGVALLAYRFSWVAPAAVAAAAPFAWYHEFGPTELTVSKAAFAGALAGIVAALIADPVRRQRLLARLRWDYGVLALAGFALLSGASMLWALSPPDAARDALKWAWYAGALALTSICVEGPGDAAKVAIAMLSSAVAVCAVGFRQLVTVAPSSFSENGDVIGRIASTLEGPNQFGGYLETIIPLLLAVLLFARLPRLARVAGALFLGALGGELLMAFSRGALWSCAAAAAFVLIAYAWQRRGDGWPAWGRLLLVAALAAVVLVPVARPAISGPGWRHEYWSAGLGDTSNSAQRRKELWRCATDLYARHPAIGVGAGNFADASAQCGPELASAGKLNANNWYLETAADLGTIGLGVLIAFLTTQFVTARRASTLRDPIALGAYAALIAFALHGFVDDVMPYPKAALSLFVLLGMIPPEREP